MRITQSRIHMATALIAALLVSGSLSAGTVSMTFAGVGKGNSGYRLYYNGAQTHSGTVFAGQIKWNVTASTDPSVGLGNQVMFCTDIFDAAASGQFNVADLANTPSSNNAPANAVPMTATKAALVTHLYSKHHAGAADSNATGQLAAAFQLALWEIVNEDLDQVELDGGFNLAATGGQSFHVTGGSANSISDAMDMLADVFAAWQGDTLQNQVQLAGLVNAEAQDMIVIIPMPRAVWLMAAGLPAVLLLRRCKSVVAA